MRVLNLSIGFFAPKGTSQVERRRWPSTHSTINSALKMPDVKRTAEGLGLDTAAGTPADLGATWHEDYDRWSKLICNLKLEAK